MSNISRFNTKDSSQPRIASTAANFKHTSFSDLGISGSLQAALTSMSIRTPTEVQAACIPPLSSGRDCIGNAQTGSGKTITFALPILQKLAVDPYGIFALVLTPTRSLAFQISEQFAVLGAALNIRTAVIVGGMDMMAQSLELGDRPHVVIATPGRLVDHLNSGSGEWNLSRVKFLVLDEADRLLTPTFAPELAHLFGVLPKSRQTCLFTATMTDSIENLINAKPQPGKQKPFVYRMSETIETVETLKQHYILVPSHVRESYLYHLLCNPPESTLHMRRAPPEPAKKLGKPSKSRRDKKPTDEEDFPEQPPPTIIFCNRPRTAAYLTLVLKTLSIRSTALHSRLTQRERLSSLSLFRSSVVPVLVSTDVGSRGLDIEDVALVINWDVPMEPEEYTHRVGRTARAGKGGVAISFVTERDEDRVLRIEDRINTQLTEMSVPEAKVLEKLNAVSTAKRLANMEIHDSDFGKREKIQKMKLGDSRSESGITGRRI
ncbi:DEAD-domain-containing protein [Guyanagaster necrorhizus]|uniref:DEAD-domain-containing protein n=1 Tax=Guyanagaster necrorhizus TaxID=856835 RepID=A0A9P7VYX9_9AGAR|nr:DEAD-domain-containing protein [Guyanagaster necrorhizus MCA 3950]KAG7449305.1 DEAD-domain-containing protein [Guyanagaster necrorhizus MCA 3950]